MEGWSSTHLIFEPPLSTLPKALPYGTKEGTGQGACAATGTLKSHNAQTFFGQTRRFRQTHTIVCIFLPAYPPLYSLYTLFCLSII
jgi:hypothetical protein